MTAAAFMLAAVASLSADESIVGGVGVEETVASALVSSAGADGQGGVDGLSDTRLDYPASLRVTQAGPLQRGPTRTCPTALRGGRTSRTGYRRASSAGS